MTADGWHEIGVDPLPTEECQVFVSGKGPEGKRYVFVEDCIPTWRKSEYQKPQGGELLPWGSHEVDDWVDRADRGEGLTHWRPIEMPAPPKEP